MKRYFRALTIAGSDSGGGAGIQADLKTFSALGCYGMSVITAITAQNTQGVFAIYPLPIEIIRKQLETVLSDIGADAIKIGMLHSAEVIRTVADCLKEFGAENIVLDPVMLSKGGDKLLQDEAVEALKEYLFPIADIITPNLPEAEVLLNRRINGVEDMKPAVKELAKFGSKAVLLKGGHLEGDESLDIFREGDHGQMIELAFKRIDTRNSHGTGCTLSSAIASYLASGSSMEEAVFLAKNYVSIALYSGKDYKLGQGIGPVHHFYNFWD